MATVDQKAVEKDWNARGFSCDLWIDAPGRVWRDFIHETDELVMLVEGEEEFEMNGQIHRLEIGQELLIPAGTYHTARNVGRRTSKWLYGYKRTKPLTSASRRAIREKIETEPKIRKCFQDLSTKDVDKGRVLQ